MFTKGLRSSGLAGILFLSTKGLSGFWSDEAVFGICGEIGVEVNSDEGYSLRGRGAPKAMHRR